MVPWTIVPVDGKRGLRGLGECGVLTSLELNCDRLVRTLHQKPTTCLSARLGRSQPWGSLVQHAPGLRCVKMCASYLTSFMMAVVRVCARRNTVCD